MSGVNVAFRPSLKVWRDEIFPERPWRSTKTALPVETYPVIVTGPFVQ